MDLIEIAMVDDLATDRRILTEKIAIYMATYDLEHRIYEYDSAEEFLATLQQIDYSIVFMDIYMDGLTGVEAAKRLRSFDRDCKLVFLTTSEEHLREALSLSSSDYLGKPLVDEDFLRAMANCRVTPEYDVPSLKVEVCGKTVSVETGRIFYIDVCNRSTVIHLVGNDITVNQPFSKITEALLGDRRFLLCMKGILVNLDKVKRLEGDCFRMKNGTLLPLNVRSKKALATTYESYVFKRMRGVR